MNKRGQSIIEYTLIAVLVILGILFMGPYVLRSVNAHFKLWDEGVQDSFKENLNQAPVNDVPTNDINTNCKCWDEISNSCGSTSPTSQCGANQRIVNHHCSIQYCDGAPLSSCKYDPTCCSGWLSGGCGNYTLPSANGTLSPIPPISCPTGANGLPGGSTCAAAPTANNCYFGYEIESQQCGTNTSVQCVKDPTDCPAPSCQGTIYTDMTPCPISAPFNGDPLTHNTGITYVSSASACNGLPCQYVHSFCGVSAFDLPNARPPGWSGQTCGDTGYFGWQTIGAGGPIATDEATAMCAAYGFKGGYHWAGQHFNSGPYGNNFYMLNPARPTGGNFTWTFNNHTNAFQLGGGCNNWVSIGCNQNSTTSPDNATPCRFVATPGQTYPSTIGQSYEVVSSCDANLLSQYPCQATCNPGYSPIAAGGPCLPSRCGNSLPINSAACPYNPVDTLLPYNLTGLSTTQSSCQGSNSYTTPCMAYCLSGYSPTSDTVSDPTACNAPACCATNTCPTPSICQDLNGSSPCCVPNSCGDLPANATACENTPPPTTSGINYTIYSTCSTAAIPPACSAACNKDYHQSGQSCVANSCVCTSDTCLNGSLTGGEILCSTTAAKNPPPATNNTVDYVISNTGCDGTTACQIECASGYTYTGSGASATCAKNTCGTIFAGSSSCNSSAPASNDTPYTYVTTCGSTACTATCPKYYSPSGDASSCTLNTCGTLISGASSCNSNAPSTPNQAYTYVTTCGSAVCSAECPTGESPADGGTDCVSTATPTP